MFKEILDPHLKDPVVQICRRPNSLFRFESHQHLTCFTNTVKFEGGLLILKGTIVYKSSTKVDDFCKS